MCAFVHACSVCANNARVQTSSWGSTDAILPLFQKTLYPVPHKSQAYVDLSQPLHTRQYHFKHKKYHVYLSIICVPCQTSIMNDNHPFPYQCCRLVEVLTMKNLLLEVGAEQMKQPTDCSFLSLTSTVGIIVWVSVAVGLKLKNKTNTL